MVLGDLDSYMQKNETRWLTHTIQKNKFKVDKKLKYKSWHHKSPRGEHREISDMPRSSIFSDMSPRARDIKERINKWDFVKIRSFWTVKENISKMKREPTIWKNILANDTSEKDLIPKIYIELDSTLGRQTTQLENGQRTWTETSPRRTYGGPRDMKGCLASLGIREIQMKTTMRYHFAPIRMTIITKSRNNRCWWCCEEKGTLVH